MKTHNVLTHLWGNNFSELKFSGYEYPRVRILWYPYPPR